MNSTVEMSPSAAGMSEAEAIRYKDLEIERIQMAVKTALRQLGLVKDEISEREAFRRFGAATIRTWENKGWIKAMQPGGKGKKKTYSLTELETVERLVRQGILK